MKKVIHKANTRGYANHGWLKSYHTFSFAGYHNPERVHFGMLRVLNDDFVDAGMGFGKHPHDNMEIISIPLSGALHHQDSTGRDKIIKTGDVQIMSAGTGIYHSELNASQQEPVAFLQLWIFPKVNNIEPRYDQKEFNLSDHTNQFQVVVSPTQENDSLFINQDAWLSLIELEEGKDTMYTIHKEGNGVYCFVIDGQLEIADENNERRDAIGIWDTTEFSLKANQKSTVLIIEVPMN
ncbi:MAG: pirin family protein [Bacteroidota bacterium]|jgi:redox-sensitive bicupin YhaK (pirin superfamily)